MSNFQLGNLILNDLKKEEELEALRNTVRNFESQFVSIKKEIMKELSEKILDKINSIKQLQTMNAHNLDAC